MAPLLVDLWTVRTFMRLCDTMTCMWYPHAGRIFEFIQHLLEFSQRAEVVIRNLGEVVKGLLQPGEYAAHRRSCLAAAIGEPVKPISRPAAGTVTRGGARSRESAKSVGADERRTAHFNGLDDGD
jgi:hypothetical protein